MTTQLSIDRARTALLIMDYQNDIVGSVSAGERTGLLHRASSVLDATRKAGIPVVYVVVSFRPGHPEISARNKSFSAMKSTGRLREGATGARVHGSVRPDPGEVIVTKRRVGAFSTTDMETVLRSMGVTNLVLAGISTSGVVLSTVRWAADADYEIVVLADCCADPDPEVHRVLTEKIFPRQAAVARSLDYLHALG
jgi:nicotinamidase-related amidase